MLSTVRIGMVGAGAVAARHVRTLLVMEGVEVAAVADPALERAKELAAEAGGAAYPNHMELLSSEGLDAVYICVPPFAHGAPELAVIDAGLPMFVEKPVAIDQETAAAIAARLAGRSLVTCTGYHWRWLDIFDRAADRLADRPARLVQCFWLDKVPPPRWWLRRDGSGGQTIEQTTHVLDTARGLAGDVVEVHSYGSRAAANPPTGGSAGPRTGRVAQGAGEGARLSTDPARLATVDAAPAEAALPAADIHDVSVASLRFASG
ncbi:MAG TPA: Gfo/Idh/MocA family oxidoreductase, partial [Actinomycetota bacterium]|nr:Gfo/Idh/MocA family oxidoreductase [Actinomycetota bacterium]